MFASLQQQYDDLTVLTHAENQGKGGAVQTGLLYAHEHGFSHAIQVDADGQHSLDDIAKLIDLSNNEPNNVISGCPIYDSSVPKHRYLSRYITHFWVWVETLSLILSIQCVVLGVYPLTAVKQLMASKRLANAWTLILKYWSDFYWQGVKVTFLPTQVIYPENGVFTFALYMIIWGFHGFTRVCSLACCYVRPYSFGERWWVNGCKALVKNARARQSTGYANIVA